MKGRGRRENMIGIQRRKGEKNIATEQRMKQKGRQHWKKKKKELSRASYNLVSNSKTKIRYEIIFFYTAHWPIFTASKPARIPQIQTSRYLIIFFISKKKRNNIILFHSKQINTRQTIKLPSSLNFHYKPCGQYRIVKLQVKTQLHKQMP